MKSIMSGTKVLRKDVLALYLKACSSFWAGVHYRDKLTRLGQKRQDSLPIAG